MPAKSKAKKHTVVTKPESFLNKTTKARGVTLAKDKDGFFLLYASLSKQVI